jgi:hypothetical protein
MPINDDSGGLMNVKAPHYTKLPTNMVMHDTGNNSSASPGEGTEGCGCSKNTYLWLAGGAIVLFLLLRS